MFLCYCLFAIINTLKSLLGKINHWHRHMHLFFQDACSPTTVDILRVKSLKKGVTATAGRPQSERVLHFGRGVACCRCVSVFCYAFMLLGVCAGFWVNNAIPSQCVQKSILILCWGFSCLACLGLSPVPDLSFNRFAGLRQVQPLQSRKSAGWLDKVVAARRNLECFLASFGIK